MASILLTKEHLDTAQRRRRIYVNNDVGYGGPMGPQLCSITPQEWIAARFSSFTQPGSQVDSVGWCLDEGNIAAYPSQVLPQLQYPTLQQWWAQGVDLVDLITAESRRRSLECFWEYRLNGADREADVNTPARHPLKDQHPEWLVQHSWWKPGMWNFAVPDVREYKLAILREVAQRYDLDGINLDFGRHPPFLPYGEQWTHREALTDFVCRVRVMLQEIAERRGRPFLLSVRVADTVPGCHFDGLDVETWVQRDLIDMVVIGTRSIQADLAGFREIVKGSHVRLFPCIDQHHSPDGYHRMSEMEFFRGVAANWWHQGADGVATFNFWNELPEAAGTLGTSGPVSGGQSVHARVYREVGDPEGLRSLDKWFVVSRRYGGGWEEGWNDYINMNHQAPLPLVIGSGSVWLEIHVADDVAATADSVERLQLHLLISGEPTPESVGVKFNGIELHNPQIASASPTTCATGPDTEPRRWVYTLTPLQMAVGRNLLTMRRDASRGGRAAVLGKAEVRVAYRSATAHGTPAHEGPNTGC